MTENIGKAFTRQMTSPEYMENLYDLVGKRTIQPKDEQKIWRDMLWREAKDAYQAYKTVLDTNSGGVQDKISSSTRKAKIEIYPPKCWLIVVQLH